MRDTPLPSPYETRTNAVFDALLWALSRPGLERQLPRTGEAQIVETLVDRECRVHAADPRLMPVIAQTGAEIAPLERADHAFLGRLTDIETLARIPQGSDLYPDEGATVILQVTLGSGPRIRLTGPGVDGRLDLQVDGLPDGFWTRRSQVMRYPMGFELYLLDQDRIVGLPRSTDVEVL